MSALILDGKKVAEQIKLRVKTEIENLPSIPHLTVFLETNDPASELYVKNKMKVCDEVGIRHRLIRPSSFRVVTFEQLIKLENDKPYVNGILVQLPLSQGLNKHEILEAINPKKDVDCFTVTNVGLLLQGRPQFTPCTPAGILEILKYYNLTTHGKKICIINRSDVVGKPMFASLIQDVEMGNGTVAICHDKTPYEVLKETCHWADIIIVAVGIRNFLTLDLVTERSIVIDVGINRTESGAICGDADFVALKDKVKAISTVPGGVGPTTVAMLMQNTVHAYKMQLDF